MKRPVLVALLFATSSGRAMAQDLYPDVRGSVLGFAAREGHAWDPVRVSGSPPGPVTIRPAREDTVPAAPRPPDLPASGLTLSAALLRDLPVDDPRAALPASPGVVLQAGPGEVGVAAAPEVRIRGGTAGEAAAYVDGAPVRFETLGSQNLVIGSNALDELTVITGVPSIIAADARDGVVQYTTRSGGPTFAAHLRATTDEFFGNGSSVGFNRFEGEAGGPFPGAAALTWFVSAGVTGQGSPYYGPGAADQPTFILGATDTVVQLSPSGAQSIPTFVQYSGACGTLGNPGDQVRANYGADCHGLERPMNWSTETRLQGKARFAYGNGSSVWLTLVGSDLQQRDFPGAVINVPGLYEGSRTWSRLAVVNWRHELRRDGELHLEANLSFGSDKAQAGLLTTATESGTRDPGLGIEFSSLDFTGLDSIPFPLTDQIIRNVRTNSGLRAPYLGNASLRNAQPYRINPFGLADNGWFTQGLDGTLSFASENRWNGRAALAWNPAPPHQVTAGVDASVTDLTAYTSGLLTQVGFDGYIEHPKRVGVFATDRIEAKGLVADLGLRYDRYTPGGEFPNVPGRIFSNPAWNPAAATEDTAYTNSVSRVFTPTHTQSFVSPRIRVAYRVSDATTVRAGYGVTVRPPSYDVLFGGVNNDLSFTSAGAVFGRDVDFVHPSLIEIGVDQRLGTHWLMDAALYQQGGATYAYRIVGYDDPANPGRTLDVNSLTTLDPGNITGADARLAWNPSGVVGGTAAYSYLHQPEADKDVTFHAVYVTGTLRIPVDWNAGNFWGTLGREVTAVATYRLSSGLTYFPLLNTGSGATVGPIPNSAPASGSAEASGERTHLPASHVLDLRIGKMIHAGPVAWGVYFDARNLLGTTNQVGAYAETGSASNSLYEQRLLAPEHAILQTEATSNGFLLPGGDIDLRDCPAWTGTSNGSVNCVALQRVEQRFGNGDRIYTLNEQTRALSAYFDSFYGAWRFYGAGRTMRLELTVTF